MTYHEFMMDTLGYLAGLLTTLAFLPQAVQTFRSKSTKDINLAMWLLFCTGVLCWLLYGILLGALPIIVANTATLCLAGSILVLKIIHG
jgi:MtN3 and saliva related transmembrane protein